jgi:hypothetical protein
VCGGGGWIPFFQEGVILGGMYADRHKPMLSGVHVTTRSQVADGRDGPQVWRVVASVMNEQSMSANKGWSSIVGVARELTSDHKSDQRNL